MEAPPEKSKWKPKWSSQKKIFVLVPLLMIGCTVTQVSCPPDAYQKASTVIEERNSLRSEKTISIARWSEIQIRMSDASASRRVLFLIASYCTGIDHLQNAINGSQLSETSSGVEYFWLFNDDYKDIDKVLKKVDVYELSGPVYIMDNDHYGCYNDQRERNRLILEEIWEGEYEGIVYQSGLVILMFDENGRVMKGTNSTSRFIEEYARDL